MDFSRSKSQKFSCQTDPLRCLDSDMSLNILSLLEDPSDVFRLSATSVYWRDFVIKNHLCKLLCLKMYPELASSEHIIENEFLERDHYRVYAFLAKGLTSNITEKCIKEVIKATHEDHFEEGTEIPATLQYILYKLASKLCVVTEIHVRPFEGATSGPSNVEQTVRFRFGHKLDGPYTWTYTSSEYPLAQENGLQVFKLPKPMLCIGGFMEVQLLNLLCITHVRVVGRPLYETFDVEIIDSSGRCNLKYECLSS